MSISQYPTPTYSVLTVKLNTYRKHNDSHMGIITGAWQPLPISVLYTKHYKTTTHTSSMQQNTYTLTASPLPPPCSALQVGMWEAHSTQRRNSILRIHFPSSPLGSTPAQLPASVLTINDNMHISRQGYLCGKGIHLHRLVAAVLSKKEKQIVGTPSEKP